jgi:hypothetical protein
MDSSSTQTDDTTLREKIQAQIAFDPSASFGEDLPIVESVIGVMELVMSNDLVDEYKINGQSTPRQQVVDTYRRIGFDHVSYVVAKYKAQDQKITSPKAYLLSMLFNVVYELPLIKSKSNTVNTGSGFRPQQRRNRFINFQQRDYDFAAIERAARQKMLNDN